MNAWLRRNVPLALALVASAAAAATLFSQTAAPTPLTMLSRDGRRSIALVLVGDQEYVALDELAGVFQLTMHEDTVGALTLAYKNRTVVLTLDQALASVAGRLVSLPAPPVRTGRRWFVPVEFISRGLALVYDAALDLRKTAHLLVVGDLRVPSVTAKYEPAAPGGRLTVDATPRAPMTVTQDGDRLLIKFDADALDFGALLPAPGTSGVVQAVRPLNATTLVVELAPHVGGFRATTQSVGATARLTIDVTSPDATTQPPPAAAVPAPVTDPQAVLTPPASHVRTVAIDPGHGGSDDGVRGSGGTKEKDVTLAVARRAKAAIEGRLGLRVLLTRDDDRELPIDARTALANNNKADLFISLHVNASFRPADAGASVYYAADGPGAAPGAVTRVQTFGGGMREIEIVDWNVAQSRHLDESGALADIILDAFRDHVPLAPRPRGRAPLAVLASANMPAVLVEMGVLTSPAQEPTLVSDEWQTAVVQALADVVVRYRAQADKADQ